MFITLRSRLLVSYTAVILATLLVVAVTLFIFATLPGIRYLPTLQRLAAVSQSNRYELLRLRDAGADGPVLERALDRAAADNNVRIVVTTLGNNQVVYDSDSSQSWVGVTVQGVVRPQRLWPGIESDAIAGRFQHPNGSSWLVYSSAVFGRALIFYAQREPTPLSFFQAFFLRPLLGAGIIAFLLSVLLAAGIAGSVAGPLRRLAEATEAVAQGDYDQRLQLQGPEEVQRVAGSFNSMAAQVKKSQQAQRDFVANVSHDLKTPLTSIRGWSQALLDGTAATAEEQQHAAGIIYSEGERMARLVNQLLDLARLDAGQLQLAQEAVDVGQLLAGVYHTLSHQAQTQQIEFILDLRPIPPVLGDLDRLMQVFTNLADNALVHTPAGGRVCLAVQTAGSALTVTITDTGVGIAVEDLPRIFERFYQADKSRSRANGRNGAGLGLAVARELVEAHGGRIQVASRPGEGTTFTVQLPAVAPETRPT